VLLFGLLILRFFALLGVCRRRDACRRRGGRRAGLAHHEGRLVAGADLRIPELIRVHDTIALLAGAPALVLAGARLGDEAHARAAEAARGDRAHRLVVARVGRFVSMSI